MIYLAFLRKHWKAILIGAGYAVLLAFLAFKLIELANTKALVEKERAGRARDRAAYAHAQQRATELAVQQKIETEKRYEDERKKADAAYADLSGQYSAAVLRYKAAQRASGKADLPSATAGTQGIDRSGSRPVLFDGITITEEDALICADNTARLQSAHDWALSIEGNAQ